MPCRARWPLDETWDYSHGWVVGETGVTCNWDNVRVGSLDMPTCTAGICGGHNGDDVLPFRVKVWFVLHVWYDDFIDHTGATAICRGRGGGGGFVSLEVFDCIFSVWVPVELRTP